MLHDVLHNMHTTCYTYSAFFPINLSPSFFPTNTPPLIFSAIDVAAPGVNIITADSLQFASNNPSVGYAFVEGTSFSVPITVGIMALLQARIKASSLNRFMRVEELRWLVRASVDKNDNLQNVKPVGSGGRINGQAAVTLLNRIIAGQAQFFQGDNPAPATKGRASCQILFFSGFGHSGDVYRHRVDWFDVNNRRVFVAQNLELSNVRFGGVVKGGVKSGLHVVVVQVVMQLYILITPSNTTTVTIVQQPRTQLCSLV